MVGILVYPAEPDDKKYKYYKNPKKVLDLDDENAIRFVRGTPHVSMYFHFPSDMDKKKTPDLIKFFEDKMKWLDAGEYTKCKNGFITGDKKYILRIVKCDKDWFTSRNL